jgi:hypothetical protein
LFLDAGGVAEQHLEHGQSAAGFRQFLGHVIRRGNRHQRVEADVVLAAERAGVGKSRRGDHVPQRRAVAQTLDDLRHQPRSRRFLHQGDERFQIAEGQPFRALLGVGGGDAQVGRQAGTDAGDDRAGADVGQELTPCFRIHRHAPARGEDSRRRHPRTPVGIMVALFEVV